MARLEQKDVRYRGYSTQPDDYQVADGAIAFATNAVFEDGGIKTIPESMPLHLVVAEGAEVYVHHTVNYYHYIIVYKFTDTTTDDDGNETVNNYVRLYVVDKELMEKALEGKEPFTEALAYIDAIYHKEYTDDDFEETDEGHDYPKNMTRGVVDFLYKCAGEFVSIVAVANTLIVSTDEQMYYFLCKPGGVEDEQTQLTQYCNHPYIYLGNKVPSVDVEFGLRKYVVEANYDDVGYTTTNKDRVSNYVSMGYVQFEYRTQGPEDFKLSFNKDLTINSQYTYCLALYNTTYYAVETIDTISLYGEKDGVDTLIYQTSTILYTLPFSVANTYSNLYIVIRTAANGGADSGLISLRRAEQGGLGSSNYYIEYTEENYEAVLGYINKFVAGYATEKDKFIHPFFVRYAVRMYDSSICELSVPILMMPNSGYAPFVVGNTMEEGSKAEGLFLYAFVADLQYKLQEGLSSNWQDLIQSVDVYVSQPIYPYDQGKNYDETINLFTYKDYGTYTRDYDDEKNAQITVDEFTDLSLGYGSLYSMENEAIDETYSKHDLFLCAKDVYGLTNVTNQTSNIVWRITQVAAKETSAIDEEIYSTSNFYLVKKINFEDLRNKSDDFVNLDLVDGTLSGLPAREALSEDVIGYEQFVGSSLCSYNSRLHTFGGYLMYRDITNIADQSQYLNSGNAWHIYEAWVYIRTNDGTKVAHTTYDEPYRVYEGSVWFFYPNNRASKVVLGYYEAIRSDVEVYMELPLSEHDFLNGAYFFLRSEKGLADEALEEYKIDNPPSGYDESIPSQSIYVSEVNNPFAFRNSTAVTVGSGKILALSSAAQAMSQGQFGQYPLYAFTEEGVWALSVNTDGTYGTSQPITRDVCTNVDSITQLDSSVLFVTDRGIMELAGSSVACISEAIESEFGQFNPLDLPYFADLFTQYIAGIEPTAEEYEAKKAEFEDMVNTWAKTRFFNFIKTCRMVYDYVHQRIIVYNTTSNIGYNYSLKSKEWSLMFTELRYSLNSYPEALALGRIDDDVYGTWCHPDEEKSDEEHWELEDMSTYNGSSSDDEDGDGDADEETEPMMFVSRPFKLDAPDIFKTVESIIQRGYFQQSAVENHIIGTVLYGSPDLFNWYMVGQSATKEVAEGSDQLTPGHIIDKMQGSPYKYFRVLVMCRLNASENIYGCSLLYELKDNNILR